MGLLHLAVFILQEHGFVALGHPWRGIRAAESGRVEAGGDSMTARLNSHQLHIAFRDKTLEDAHGIRPTADTGKDPGRHLPMIFHDLLGCLQPDDGLKPGHHLRKGVRPADGSKDIMGLIDIGDPVTEGLVNGVLEGAGTVGHRDNGGPHLLHPEDIGTLASHIFLTHIDRAGKAEFGGHGGSCHTVLTSPGLSNHPFLAHPLDQ